MERRTLTAKEGKIFAFTGDNGEIVKLGSTLYLGINDDGSRYFEVDSEEENNG